MKREVAVLQTVDRTGNFRGVCPSDSGEDEHFTRVCDGLGTKYADLSGAEPADFRMVRIN